jgi:hypothetical protein
MIFYISLSKKYGWTNWKQRLTGKIVSNTTNKRYSYKLMEKVTYKNVHNRFKLNGVHLDKQDLCSLSHALIKEGDVLRNP